MFGFGSGGGGGYDPQGYLGDYSSWDSSTAFDNYTPMDFSNDYSFTDTYDFNNAASNFTASDYFTNSLSNVGNWDDISYDYASLTPSIYDSVDFGDTYSPTFNYNQGLSGLDLDFGNILETASQLDDFTSTYDPFEDSDLSLEEAAIISDIQKLDAIELAALEDLGLIEYNEDGSINSFDTNTAIVGIENALIQNRDDMDVDTYQTLLSTRNELIGAVDAGIDKISIDKTDHGPQMPLDAKRVNAISGGEKFISPYDSKWGMQLTGKGKDKPFYSGGRFANEGQRPTKNMGMALNPMAVERAGIRQQFADSLSGDDRSRAYNAFSQFGLTPGQQTFNTRFDTFTDRVADGASMLLSPIDFVADGVGDVFSAIGQGIGDNVIGRGFNNFGNWLDQTGDKIVNDIPGRILNAPDNLVDFGTGAYRFLTGAETPLGQPGAVDLMKNSALGLIKTPFQLVGDIASIPASLMRDVFGIDEISIGIGGKAGGGGGRGRPKAKKKERKNVPIVGNKKGSGSGVSNSNRGSSGVGGDPDKSTLINEDGTEYDLGNLDDRNAFAEKYGEGALAGRMADLNIASTGASGDADADTLKTSEADRSQVAESIGANQGNSTGVKKAPSAEPVDVLDNMVGAGQEVDMQEMIEDNSTGFKTSDLFEDDAQPIFAYEGEEAFA